MVQKLYLKTSNGTKIVPKNFFLSFFSLSLYIGFSIYVDNIYNYIIIYSICVRARIRFAHVAGCR